jgi:hypothetical protein
MVRMIFTDSYIGAVHLGEMDFFVHFSKMDFVVEMHVIGHGIGGKHIPAKMARLAESQLLE